MGGFVHLHVASGYSARCGASHPEALVARAAERGMTELALTDRDTMAGMVRFVQACAAHGIRPILGVDVAVASHRPTECSPSPPWPCPPGSAPYAADEPPAPFSLPKQRLAVPRPGHGNG
ncbi:hypothetical protein GCM10010289_74490 [Streptomyces violascens]|nr:hypothetical protein GCM10010289_74490 [Streptomyces violascens]